MISTSNSRAGDRLRRTKSTSSTHTTSSGHYRSPTTIDPVAARQQAEAAAIEAYHRARQLAQPSFYGDRPAPPKLQRRRSHRTTEGSHFEEARLGRKKSTSRKEDGRVISSSRAQQRRGYDGTATTTSGSEERVVTRRRSIISPNPDALQSYTASQAIRVRPTHTNQMAPTSDRHRHITPKERSANPHPQPSWPKWSGHYHSQLSALSSFGEPIETSGLSTGRRTPKRPARENQTDEEILALARDRCLQDFQQQKHLRERKSFLAGTLQRLKGINTPKATGLQYDTSLPPFNYAEGVIQPPSLAPSPPPLPTPIDLSEVPSRSTTLGSRHLSESLKGRLKRVFRKPSRVPTTLPIQHIQTTQLHFPVLPRVPTPIGRGVENEDPFIATFNTDASDHSGDGQPDQRSSSGITSESVGKQSTARSRVTSWTDSTSDGHQADLTGEAGHLKRSDSVSTLRRAGSFLGPIRHTFRRPSKTGLNSSEESAGLYSALRERIRPSESAGQPSKSEETSQSRPVSALSTLPSQLKHAASSIASASHWAAPTIRPVTPDNDSQKLDVLSPVPEILSPPGRHDERANLQGASPKSQLHRRPAIKAITPTREQVNRRLERSHNRWQTTLNDISPTVPRPLRYDGTEDNPYELRSLSRTMVQPEYPADRPYHVRVGDNGGEGRHPILSPSLYSRETDDGTPSPKRPGPVERDGMVVTITGHEVRSYPISPAKHEPPIEAAAQSSREWRRWLSSELKDWNEPAASELLSLPKGILKNRKSSSPVDVEALRQMDEREKHLQQLEIEPDSPPSGPEAVQVKHKRSRAALRRLGFMNDRYPTIDSARSSSGTSSDRKASDTGHRTASSSSVVRKPVRQQPIQKQDEFVRDRVISKRSSAFEIGASAGIVSDDDQSSKMHKCPTASTTRPDDMPGVIASRRPAAHAKSAFDLRANYKSGRSSPVKRIEVRRKAQRSDSAFLLDDSTIRNISAGPYADARSQPYSFQAAEPLLGLGAADGNKENESPPGPVAFLPAISSSEWIDAAPIKRREVRRGTQPPPKESVPSKYSPVRTGNGGTAGGSPGQRLVTGWLDAKRSKEKLAGAFV